MAITTLFGEKTFLVSIAVGSLVVLSSLFAYLFHKPPFPKNAPRLTREAWPILGSLQFFTERWDFYQRSMAQSPTRNFSFYAGQWPVVALAGDQARKVFFESKGLGFSEGYGALLGGTVVVTEDNNPLAERHDTETGFSAYFNKRIISMLKGNRLAEGLPKMLSDAREALDKLATESNGMTDPFDSIYRMVYRFTMRTVACNEIADDPALLDKTLHLYEQVEATATPISIMFPWIPTLAKFKRILSGGQLYTVLKKVVDDRKKEDRRENDALQYLIDQGDSVTDMITFVLGALFAGQLNTGVNAAWVLVYLANKPYWLERVVDEVQSVAARYAPDESLPLEERLMSVPANAWEGEFPIVDMCLKDSIRLQMNGAAFRKNISGKDIALNKDGSEVIPKDAYVTLSAGDGHYNPAFFENPDEWDPSRYMPDRQEDKNGTYGFFGWGVGRHPCLGMRFAKMEVNVIVAFFVAYFDNIQLVDKDGKARTRLPAVDRNRHTAARPDERVYLKFSRRDEKAAA